MGPRILVCNIKYNCGRFLELEMILWLKKHPIIGLSGRDTVLNVQLLNNGLCVGLRTIPVVMGMTAGSYG